MGRMIGSFTLTILSRSKRVLTGNGLRYVNPIKRGFKEDTEGESIVTIAKYE